MDCCYIVGWMALVSIFLGIIGVAMSFKRTRRVHKFFSQQFQNPAPTSNVFRGNGPAEHCQKCSLLVANYTRDRDGLATCANCERGGSG